MQKLLASLVAVAFLAAGSAFAQAPAKPAASAASAASATKQAGTSVVNKAPKKEKKGGC